jgi:ParB/RepB/Spo0J family partition protein
VTLALGTHDSRLIPLSLLLEPLNPSRTAMDELKLDELAVNIGRQGVLSHLIVVVDGDHYEIVAGHRRFFASRRAGLLAVPCDVYADREIANEAAQYAENRFREELSPADEAIWFDDLLHRKCGGDVDVLCERIGERRAYVEGRLLLFQGDPKVFEALTRGEITIGVAQQLNRCDEELHRRMLLDNAIRGGATVALVSGWIAEWFQVHKPANANVEIASSAAAPAPVAVTDYFRCVLCDKTDNVHLMQPRNMHSYCEQAMFAEMLERYERRHEYVRYPRTTDEACALISELAERFPAVLEPEDPRRI